MATMERAIKALGWWGISLAVLVSGCQTAKKDRQIQVTAGPDIDAAEVA
jgi:hypothetical protein